MCGLNPFHYRFIPVPSLGFTKPMLWSLTFFSVWIISTFLKAQHLILHRQPLPFLPRDHQHSDPCLDTLAPCSSQRIEMTPLQTLSVTTKRAHAYVCLHTTLSSESYCFLQRLTLLVGSLYLRQPSYKRKRFVLTQFWRLWSIISWTHCFQS